jgi:uncharacterized protein (DUF2235 family)
MAKNVVIFSDGTGQAGGVRPDQRLSNVYKIFRAARVGPDSPIDPREQVAFYDPGLGTDEDCTALTRAWRFVSKTLSAATGRGITRNVTDCYEAILNLYEPGDRIFLFGFSRGAYTARCVAGVIRLCGVPTRGRDGKELPRFRSETRAIADEAVRHVYEHGAGRDRDKFRPEREWKAQQFRRRYGSEGTEGSNACPHFIGVFDTVASLGARGIVRFAIFAGLILGAMLGALLLAMLLDFAAANARVADVWPGSGEFRPFGWVPELSTPLVLGLLLLALALVVLWKTFTSSFKYVRGYPGGFRWHFAKWKMDNYDSALAPDVGYARHALAIDETREHFPRVKWGQPRGSPPAPTKPGEVDRFVQLWFAGNHSDIGGSYPENESRLSDVALQWMVGEARSVPGPLLVDMAKLAAFPDSGAMQHCEIEQMRDAKPGWWPSFLWQSWPEKIRAIPPEAPVHPTVIERLRLTSVSKCGRSQQYRPANLGEHKQCAAYYAEPRPTA